MREIFRTLGKSVLLLLAGGFIGAVLLMLAYMLPINEENRDYSFEVIKQEGWYPRAAESLPTKWNFGEFFYITDRLDGFTDEIMLQTAWNLDDRNPLLQAMSSYSEIAGEYAYYWHGYVSLLRPLLLIFDITNLRMFNGMCQLALLAVLLLLIGREKGFSYAAIFLSSYLLLMPMALFMSLQYSWVFYIAAVSTLVLLCKKEYFSQKNRSIYFFVIVGMFTSYFDLLTYPLITWGMPLVWWLVTDKSQKKKPEWLRQVIYSGFSWIAGYAGMWMLKWTMASVVLGQNVFQRAISEVFYRSGASETEGYQLIDRLQAIYANWLHYEQVIFVVLLIGWALYWAWKIFRNGWCSSNKGYAYLLIGVSGFVWCFVLANHTYIHHAFTYRIFGVTLLAFLALVNDGVVRERMPMPAGTRTKVFAIWVTCALLALPLALSAREDLLVTNGGEEFRRILLDQGETVEVSFTPTFNQIKNFLLGLESAGTTGEYDISLWEGDQLKYQLSIPVLDSEGGNYRQLDVDWKLNHKKTYQLRITVQDNPEYTYVWVTTGASPLTEYGLLQVGGTTATGQLLTGITYWCRPLEKVRLLFLMFSWTCALAAVSFTFLSPWLQKRERLDA